MKLIRFIVLVLLLIAAAIGAGGYYVTHKVADELNEQYAGQKIAVTENGKASHFITFKEVVPSGFPLKISWDVRGVIEETESSKTSFTSPVQFGYDLLLQKVFVSYAGDIMSSYKPAKFKFGAKLKIEDYMLSVDLPVSMGLINTLRDLEDPVQIINHVGDINLSSDRVEIFDLIDNQKFYDKKYENMKLSFVPQKTYVSLKDLMTNIPQRYVVRYAVETNEIKVPTRKLPDSLFYVFSAVPSGMDMRANAVIKTAGNNSREITKNLEVKGDITCSGMFASVKNFKLDYKAGSDKLNRDYDLAIDSKLHLKKGAFDHLFEQYKLISSKVALSPSAKMIDREINYIIANKQAFKFQDLENSDYDFNLKMSNYHDQDKTYMKINNLDISSEGAGINLKHEIETNSKGFKTYLAKGDLLIRNYSAVVEFTSGYIYRFGKFRFLNDAARSLYVDVNKTFLKSISDHPKSVSNDLSFNYEVNSRNLKKTKLGSVTVDKISELYTLMLYKKLFDNVGSGGDVLERMQKILPGIDGKEPLLQKILPHISGGKSIEKSIKKEIDKVLPKNAQDLLKKIIPKDKLKKGFLKDLFK
ncbi:MAG: hypothetical protein COA94_04665 [Rickettsiales bacterium]|nr:MAG: hypothetical protein COA94_04665 [Rickettsiales bacterium]